MFFIDTIKDAIIQNPKYNISIEDYVAKVCGMPSRNEALFFIEKIKDAIIQNPKYNISIEDYVAKGLLVCGMPSRCV